MFIKQLYCYLCLLILNMQNSSLGQTIHHKKDGDIVFVKDFYKGYGKLFNISKNALIDHLQIEHSFLPSDQDIVMTEQLMQQRYQELIRTDQRLKGAPDNFRQFYYDYYRQYCGLVNQAGEKIVFILLFKCCKRNVKKCFPKWDKELLSPLIDDSCVKMAWFDVNLTTKRVSIN